MRQYEHAPSRLHASSLTCNVLSLDCNTCPVDQATKDRVTNCLMHPPAMAAATMNEQWTGRPICTVRIG